MGTLIKVIIKKNIGSMRKKVKLATVPLIDFVGRKKWVTCKFKTVQLSTISANKKIEPIMLQIRVLGSSILNTFVSTRFKKLFVNTFVANGV